MVTGTVLKKTSISVTRETKIIATPPMKIRLRELTALPSHCPSDLKAWMINIAKEEIVIAARKLIWKIFDWYQGAFW